MTTLYSYPCCSDIYRYSVNSEIFGRILFSLKELRHICHVNNLCLWHDLPTSVKDKEFSLFREGFFSRNSASAKFRKK